ncbi:hypothetical protein DFJ73DRAFT_762245 [Zopfochytrium polystomum]|nr:hypothetical protein DFJ73DRAFT_762245 [Zopfochytrium polystomum]
MTVHIVWNLREQACPFAVAFLSVLEQNNSRGRPENCAGSQVLDAAEVAPADRQMSPTHTEGVIDKVVQERTPALQEEVKRAFLDLLDFIHQAPVKHGLEAVHAVPLDNVHLRVDPRLYFLQAKDGRKDIRGTPRSALLVLGSRLQDPVAAVSACSDICLLHVEGSKIGCDVSTPSFTIAGSGNFCPCCQPRGACQKQLIEKLLRQLEPAMSDSGGAAKLSVSKCLQSFMSVDILGGNDKLVCEACNGLVKDSDKTPRLAPASRSSWVEEPPQRTAEKGDEGRVGCSAWAEVSWSNKPSWSSWIFSTCFANGSFFSLPRGPRRQRFPDASASFELFGHSEILKCDAASVWGKTPMRPSTTFVSIEDDRVVAEFRQEMKEDVVKNGRSHGGEHGGVFGAAVPTQEWTTRTYSQTMEDDGSDEHDDDSVSRVTRPIPTTPHERRSREVPNEASATTSGWAALIESSEHACSQRRCNISDNTHLHFGKDAAVRGAVVRESGCQYSKISSRMIAPSLLKSASAMLLSRSERYLVSHPQRPGQKVVAFRAQNAVP